MPALSAGKTAPPVALPLLGGGNFDLATALKRGPVFLAFFKISCPVCQMTFPYIERIHKKFPKSKLQIVGVSQNDAKATAAFAKEYGITFPIALEDTDKFAVSNKYGLTNVPTLFLVSPDGKIELSSVGWAKGDVQGVADAAARNDGAKPASIFKPGEDVPAFKAG
jgi:peroxiredoxin